MAKHNSLHPWPVRPEISNTGPFHLNFLIKSLTRLVRSASSNISTLFNTNHRGLLYKFSSYFNNSPTIPLACATISSSSLNGAKSTKCKIIPVRCKCRKKRWPKPAPSAAPSINPGISAMTKLFSEPTLTTPKLGCKVVNG